MSGTPGQPRSAASEPQHAPLTRHLSPGLRFGCAFFFPFLLRSAPGVWPPPPPPPPSASLPGADYLSRAALRVPGMPSAPGELAIHRGAGGRRAGGARGRRGAPAGQNLRPRRSRCGLGRGARGRGARGRRGEKGREQPRSGERASEGARRGSEGAANRREHEQCSDRDCHWGQRSIAPGSRAAKAPLRARSPAGPRALVRASCSPGPLESPPAPRGLGVARGGGNSGRGQQPAGAPGSSRRQEAELQVHHHECDQRKNDRGPGRGCYGAPGQ